MTTAAAAPPSLAVALLGIEGAVPETVALRAGPLEASLDAGNLRHLRLHGREAVRGIGSVVRDRGTGAPAITGLAESDGPRAVRVPAVAMHAGIVAWFSNVTGRPHRIRVEGAPSAGGTLIRRLDADTFAHLRRGPEALEGMAEAASPDRIELGPDAMVRLGLPG